MELIEEHQIKEVFITTITYIELLGAADLKDKLNIKRFLAQFNIVAFDERTQRSAHYLCMRHKMARKEAADFLIASIAHARGYAIITDNVRDFPVKNDVRIIKFSTE